MPSRWVGLLALAGAGFVASCAASPYDLPMTTMVGQQRGYTMIGFVRASDDSTARTKVLQRFLPVCPAGAEIVEWKTEPANRPGMKIVRYQTIATCKN